MSPGHRNALVGGKNARCQQLASCSIITAAGVKICNAAHGADGSHATQQFQLRVAAYQPVGHRTGQAIAQNFAHQRSIVPRLCAGLAVACQMHMQVDQARAQIASVQIDHLITVQIHALIDNGNDLIILGQQDLVRFRLHLLGAIQQDPVRIGTFHWEHPLFFKFFRTGVVLFQYSTFRQMVQCKNGQERFSPLLPARCYLFTVRLRWKLLRKQQPQKLLPRWQRSRRPRPPARPRSRCRRYPPESPHSPCGRSSPRPEP